MRRLSPLLSLALAACGDELALVQLHGVEPSGDTCAAVEGASPGVHWDVTAEAPYFVAVELRSFGGAVAVEELVVEVDTGAPWTFLPARHEVAVDVPLADEGDEGDRAVVVVPLLDAALGARARDGGDGPAQQSPVDEPGEEFPLNVSVVARAGDVESPPVLLVVTPCNGCVVPACAPERTRGCSLAQREGFTCE